jgi:probable F420-dependent oxidoreductase
MMRFGVQLGVDAPTSAEDLTRVAQAAENLGFDSLWLGDHLVIPVDVDHGSHERSVGGSQRFVDRSRAATSEPITSLAFLAGQVDRIRLGTAVLIVPLRNPVLAAKMLASVDNLSGGRLDVGIGAGWIQGEFDALRTPPFEERGAVTDDYLDTMVALWTQDHPEHQGPHYSVAGVAMFPKPVQRPHPPIWVGGNGTRAMRRAARIGQGWLPLFQDPEGLPRKRADLARLCEMAGRRAEDIRVAVGCRFGFVEGLGSDDRPLLCGTPNQMRDDVRRYEDVGIEELHLITAVPGASATDIVASWKRFVEEVAGRL